MHTSRGVYYKRFRFSCVVREVKLLFSLFPLKRVDTGFNVYGRSFS